MLRAVPTAIALVDTDGFREDLYFRLKGYAVTLPPLRDRGTDILCLAREVLAKSVIEKELSPEAEAFLLNHPWRGNIRELQNLVQAAAVDAPGEIIDVHHFRNDSSTTSRFVGADRRRKIVTFIRERGATTPSELRANLGISHTTLNEDARKLEQEGLIERRGKTSGVHYVVLGQGLIGDRSMHAKPTVSDKRCMKIDRLSGWESPNNDIV